MAKKSGKGGKRSAGRTPRLMPGVRKGSRKKDRANPVCDARDCRAQSRTGIGTTMGDVKLCGDHAKG